MRRRQRRRSRGAPATSTRVLAGVLAACAGGGLLTSCITNTHPLGTSGSVNIDVDVAVPLFAANALDANGAPVLPRQSPFSTAISLSLTEDGQPGWGAYVDVSVQPPEALTLASSPSESTPSCAAIAGGFRCTANAQGYANLVASSEGQWSGTAKLEVTWGGNAPTTQAITVLPAGLPPDAAAFSLLVGGLTGTAHVVATYDNVQCTTGAVPADLGTAWRPGMIRASQAFVTASPSPTEPAALANAPVLVQSLSAEAELSLLSDCSVRSPVLDLILGADGQSPNFFLCFSDNGGTINFAVTSGARAVNPQQQVLVDPEPRLLRVTNLVDTVAVNASPVNLFEVDAYNSDRVRIAIPVDITVADTTVLSLGMVSSMTTDASTSALVIPATPLMAGTTELHVTPSLFSMPNCASPAMAVTPGSTATLFNGCNGSTTLVSSAGVTIEFPMTATPLQYSPACVSVHAGQMVTFTGNFVTYPLSPGPAVDPNSPANPIMFTNTGTTMTFTFPTAGMFGFYTTADPTTMLGAVFVVP